MIGSANVGHEHDAAPVANRKLMNTKARWFLRGVLVGIALTMALNFVLTQ